MHFASWSGWWVANMVEPYFVGMFAVSIMSLIPMGYAVKGSAGGLSIPLLRLGYGPISMEGLPRAHCRLPFRDALQASGHDRLRR